MVPLLSRTRRSLPAGRTGWLRSEVRELRFSSSRHMVTQAFTIVGGGRVGSALKQMGDESDILVQRGEAINTEDGPIIVCTRNNDLQGVVDATPAARRADLVFIQNGMLEPWLDEQGLGDNTQALIYFAVSKLGEEPTDGITDVNPEGLTSVTGKHADAFAERVRSAGLTCHVLGAEEYKVAMLEKLVWISAFMLVGARHGGCTVGEVESSHRGEVEDLINELVAAGCTELSVDAKPGYVERLCAYSRSVAHFPTAVKELEWRNGWFSDISAAAAAASKPDPCPLHSQWLAEVI